MQGLQRLRPKSACVPLATFHWSKLTQGQPRFKKKYHLGCMFSGSSVECSSMRWRKWQRTCGIFNAWPSLMCQELLNLPLGVWSSLLTGHVGMEAGEWRGGQPHRGGHGFRNRAGLLTQLTPHHPRDAPISHSAASPAWHHCLEFCFARAGVCNQKVQRPFQCA